MKGFVRGYLVEYLSREEVVSKFAGHIDTKLKENINTGLKSILFRSYTALNKDDYEATIQNVIQSLPDAVLEGLDLLQEQSLDLIEYLEKNDSKIEDFLTQQVVNLLEKVDIYDLLSKQMSYFDEAKLERMIWNATNEQLVYIQLLGTVLGILGGLLIWKPAIMIAVYAGIFSILYVIDILWYKVLQSKKEQLT